MSTKTDGPWGRLPNAWIYNNGLRAFSAAQTKRGPAGAALKLYLALLLRAENRPREKIGPAQGTVELTYDQLAELSDLSRASIAQGKALLETQGLVRVERPGGGKNRYCLIGVGPDDTFGRVPKTPLMVGSITRVHFLHSLDIRNEAAVNSLKLYLMLCAMQDRASRTTRVSYEKMLEKTGIAEARISRALSILFEHGLIRPVVETAAPGEPALARKYLICGL